MSRQLAISAAFSVFATAALALFAANGGPEAAHEKLTGASTFVEAPAELTQMPKLPALRFLSN
ncbi:MAG: hypothetical protein P0Y56_06350 [Candidatus Andeanibacterium colombiense]|uniref:Uncharacterized protein n=1 Tax=Candidatus Andeanibacterium colombiense TaxID=3121345 RepID=A0AAJ5X981_9SPHN|nr:MAG: hypothetical protein P0Y56_06350 [Sphingomonadaceae bacterium]